jgi:hypothetical protein
MPMDKKQLMACAYREYDRRTRRFPEMVKLQKITQKEADHEVAAMRAIYQVIMNLPDDFIHKSAGS